MQRARDIAAKLSASVGVAPTANGNGADNGNANGNNQPSHPSAHGANASAALMNTRPPRNTAMA